MSDLAIRVENLPKLFHVGSRERYKRNRRNRRNPRNDAMDAKNAKNAINAARKTLWTQ